MPSSANEGTYIPFNGSASDRSPFSSGNGITPPPQFGPPPGGGDGNKLGAPSGGLWILAGLAATYGIFRRRYRKEG